MPSLYNIINPVNEQVNLDLQHERDAQALDAEKLSGPGLWDLAKTASESAYVNGVGFKLVGRVFNDPDINYNEKQLSELYQDAPKNYFKGGASAYQAEMLYDKFKKQQDVEVVKSLIYGQEDTSSPDWWVIGRKGRNIVPALSSIATSFSDPLTIPAMMLGGMVTKTALPISARFAPEVTKRVAMAIGTSRLASNWFPEILQNLAFEASTNYGVGKLNADFTKEDPSIKDSIINSVGTALVFGTASTLLRGYNVNFLKDSALHINDAIAKGFGINKNMLSMSLDSSTHNIHMLQEAVKDYIKNPLDNSESAASKITKRSLTYSGEEAFNAEGATHMALTDPEGNTLYTGTRHGDNFLFIDDPKAVQGMINEYNTNGENNLKVVTSTQLNNEAFNLVNLNAELANNHPDILNIIDKHIGNVSDLPIDDTSTLNDVFTAINNARVTGDLSGSDLKTMFDEISSKFNEKGFDGMRFIENIDGKVHTVSEVFPDKLTEFSHVADGESTTKPLEPSNPLDGNIVVSGGKEIPSEAVLHDPALELDEDFKSEYSKVNDKDYIGKIEMEDFPKHVEEDLQLKEEELKLDLKADASLSTEDIKTTKALDKIKESYKKEAPEKANEIFKVLENCKGKL